jgi:hypothetical protein
MQLRTVIGAEEHRAGAAQPLAADEPDLDPVLVLGVAAEIVPLSTTRSGRIIPVRQDGRGLEMRSEPREVLR